jgi:hypothetical protein
MYGIVGIVCSPDSQLPCDWPAGRCARCVIVAPTTRAGWHFAPRKPAWDAGTRHWMVAPQREARKLLDLCKELEGT